MTTFLIVLGIIALLTVIICFLPIMADLSFEARLRICIFFAGIKVYDKSMVKKDGVGKGDAPAPVDIVMDDNIKQKTPAKRISVKSFSKLCRIALDIINRLKLKLKIKNLILDIKYGGEDASETALNFGRLNAAAYTVYGAMNNLCLVENCDIAIVPTFDIKQFKIRFQIQIYGRTGNIILAFLRIMVYLIINRESLKEVKKLL